MQTTISQQTKSSTSNSMVPQLPVKDLAWQGYITGSGGLDKVLLTTLANQDLSVQSWKEIYVATMGSESQTTQVTRTYAILQVTSKGM